MGVKIVHHAQEGLHLPLGRRLGHVQNAVDLLSRKMDPVFVDRVPHVLDQL